jgi:hypothetical protein
MEQQRAYHPFAGQLAPRFDRAGRGLLRAEMLGCGAVGSIDRAHARSQEHRRALAKPLQLGPEHRNRPGFVGTAGAAPCQDEADPFRSAVPSSHLRYASNHVSPLPAIRPALIARAVRW